MVPTSEQDSRICLSGCTWRASRSCRTLLVAASFLQSGWRRGERSHGGREGGTRLLGRGGAPASHGVRWRRRRGDGQGWTVGEISTGGGRYMKYRPAPGSLSAVGSGTCGRSGMSQATTLSSSSRRECWVTGGALLEPGGRRTPRRRCSVASVRRSTARETSPLHRCERHARRLASPDQ